jgi:hypothetical protein
LSWAWGTVLVCSHRPPFTLHMCFPVF